MKNPVHRACPPEPYPRKLTADAAGVTRQVRAGLGVDLEAEIALGPLATGELSSGERSRLDSFTSPLRIQSWLTGRAALKRLRRRLGDTDDTSELQFPHPRYSLSHCGESAIAVGLARGQTPIGGETRIGGVGQEPQSKIAGVGVDLEFSRHLPPRAGRFFLTPREQGWLSTWEAWSAPKAMLALWCIKEALFKANPHNPGTLLGHYEFERPALGCGTARGPELAADYRFRYLCLDLECGYLAFAVAEATHRTDEADVETDAQP